MISEHCVNLYGVVVLCLDVTRRKSVIVGSILTDISVYLVFGRKSNIKLYCRVMLTVLPERKRTLLPTCILFPGLGRVALPVNGSN